MNEQDLLRIVRNMLSSAVDLVDSNDETQISAVLRNVRDGAAGFCSLLEEVIVDDEEGARGHHRRAREGQNMTLDQVTRGARQNARSSPGHRPYGPDLRIGTRR